MDNWVYLTQMQNSSGSLLLIEKQAPFPRVAVEAEFPRLAVEADFLVPISRLVLAPAPLIALSDGRGGGRDVVPVRFIYLQT